MKVQKYKNNKTDTNFSGFKFYAIFDFSSHCSLSSEMKKIGFLSQIETPKGRRGCLQ